MVKSSEASALAGSDGSVPRQGRDPVGSLGSRASPTWEQSVPWDPAPGCPHDISTRIREQPVGGKRNKSLFGVCLFLLAKGEGGAAPLNSRGLAPSTCSDSEKEVTGTCRQEPLTYIKKVYSRESVYISINILCIYINKYIKRKECIILMQHKAVLRERVSQNKSIAI